MQQKFQAGHGHGADNPTYLKGGAGDKMANYGAAVLCGGGAILMARGFYNMSYGINKS